MPMEIRTYDLMPIRTRPYRKKDTSFSPEGHVLICIASRRYSKATLKPASEGHEKGGVPILTTRKNHLVFLLLDISTKNL